MTGQLDLKEIERKAYTSTFEDGLIDIEFGILLLGGGINMYLRDVLNSPLVTLLFLVYAIVGLMVFFLGKKYITFPRLGVVKFSPKRKAARKKAAIITIISATITTIIFILTINNTLSFDLLEGIGGIIIIELLIITLPLSLLAYFLDFTRLYVIAVLFGLSWPFHELLRSFVGTPFDGLIAYGVTGGIVLIMGLVYLIRFLRKYPIPPKEIVNGPE